MEPYTFSGGTAGNFTDPALVAAAGIAHYRGYLAGGGEIGPIDFWQVRVFAVVDCGPELSIDLGIDDGEGSAWTDTITITREGGQS